MFELIAPRIALAIVFARGYRIRENIGVVERSPSKNTSELHREEGHYA
jgi:hypothetical protein